MTRYPYEKPSSRIESAGTGAYCADRGQRKRLETANFGLDRIGIFDILALMYINTIKGGCV